MQVKIITECSHSAILLTFIKLQFLIKTFVLSIFEWPLKTGFTVSLFSFGIAHEVLVLIVYAQNYLSRDMGFPAMWHFDKCRLRRAWEQFLSFKRSFQFEKGRN